jgi:hypothetical protein
LNLNSIWSYEALAILITPFTPPNGISQNLSLTGDRWMFYK